MIVKMKKVFLVTTTGSKNDTLLNLRRLGVLHIETGNMENEALADLITDLQELMEAQRYLSLFKEKKESVQTEDLTGGKEMQDGKQVAGKVREMMAQKVHCEEAVLKLKQEIERVTPWGDFHPAGFSALKEKGIELGLYQVPLSILKTAEETVDYMVLDRIKTNALIAVTGGSSEQLADFAFTLPAFSLSELQTQLVQKGQEIKNLENTLAKYAIYKPLLGEAILRAEKALELRQISLDMEEVSALTYVTGYLPYDQAELLKKEAAARSWGLLVTDPAEGDDVPTLIRNPRWVQIIKPVFDLLGTVPGYREIDISFWFLLFFSLFYAMIIGDAGYGIVMLLAIILGRVKMKKAPATPFILLYTMSICTIIWGVLSGTWFGAAALAHTPLLEKITLPWIASFPGANSEIDTKEFIWNFCFLIGVVHLTVARLVNFKRKLPHLAAFAELGWIIMLWGLYFFIRTMLLHKPLFYLTGWLVGIGFAIVVLLSEMNGSFFKGLGLGLAKSPLKALNAISGFSDIISYIRLYAVGLATVEVAKAFNTMALGAGVDNVLSGIIAAVILLLGHTLNIVMGTMSIIVHGVRLNMLEFSSHVGIEWTGKEYKPFKE